MHDTFSFSHYTKTKVTGLNHNYCSLASMHKIPQLPDSVPPSPHPFHFRLHLWPDTGQSAHGCSSVDTGASDLFPWATVFTKTHTSLNLFYFLCTATQSEAEVLQQHVATGHQVSCDSTKM